MLFDIFAVDPDARRAREPQGLGLIFTTYRHATNLRRPHRFTECVTVETARVSNLPFPIDPSTLFLISHPCKAL